MRSGQPEAARDSLAINPIVHIEVPDYLAARRREFDACLRIARAAHMGGVRFLAGTDCGGVPYLYYGSSLHDELALLVEAGLSPMEALRAATRNPALFLGLKDEGTVREGNIPDLVLLEANPLLDIHNTRRIRAVILRGRWLDRSKLDEMLAGVQTMAGVEP